MRIKEMKMESEGKKLRVLIVDDHAVMRESLRFTLEDSNEFIVAGEAGTGAEALEACRNASYDVVLLDVRLPDQMGPAVARALKNQGCESKIIGLSMRDEAMIQEEMLSAGADAFHSKLDSADQLLDTLRNALGRL